MFLLKLLAFFIAMTFPIYSYANINAILQTELNNWRKSHQIPGMQMTVIIPHHPPMNFSSGHTTKEKQTLVTDKALFEIGSITKSFTAMIILELIKEKKMNLDDSLADIHQQFPNFPEYPKWNKVSIRQLLSMTSGIPAWSTDDFKKNLIQDPNKQWETKELIQFSYAQPFDFLPGTYWKYSNTNYLLLGEIIEAVTHMELTNVFNYYFIGSNSKLAKQFPELALSNTFYFTHKNPHQIIDRMVHGYCYYTDEKEFCSYGSDVTTQYLSLYRSSGGLISNANDVANWIKALLVDKKFPDIYKTLTTLYCIPDEDNTCQPGEILPPDTDQLGFSMGLNFQNDPKYGPVWTFGGDTFSYTTRWYLTAKNGIIVSFTSDIQKKGVDPLALYMKIYPLITDYLSQN